MITKVKSVQAGGTWNTPKGETMYRHNYEMEDGIKIQANHKTELPFKVGDSVDYEVKKDDPQYGKSGSVKKPETSTYSGAKGGGGNDAVQLMIVRQSSLKVALDLIRHNAIGNDKQIKADDVELLADRWVNWVMTPEAQPEKVQELAQSATDSLMDDNQNV